MNIRIIFIHFTLLGSFGVLRREEKKMFFCGVQSTLCQVLLRWTIPHPRCLIWHFSARVFSFFCFALLLLFFTKHRDENPTTATHKFQFRKIIWPKKHRDSKQSETRALARQGDSLGNRISQAVVTTNEKIISHVFLTLTVSDAHYAMQISSEIARDSVRILHEPRVPLDALASLSRHTKTQKVITNGAKKGWNLFPDKMFN